MIMGKLFNIFDLQMGKSDTCFDQCTVYSVQCGYNPAAIYYQLRSDYANYLADPPVINYSLLCLNFTGAEVEQSLHPCTLGPIFSPSPGWAAAAAARPRAPAWRGATHYLCPAPAPATTTT